VARTRYIERMRKKFWHLFVRYPTLEEAVAAKVRLEAKGYVAVVVEDRPVDSDGVNISAYRWAVGQYRLVADK
jgi:hypothetical protein